MALTYLEDLTNRFTQNFSQDIVCHFPDGFYLGATDLGSVYLNMNTMSAVPAQPTNDYWLRMKVTEGVTLNSSITDGTGQWKRSLIFVEFDILWPENLSRKRMQQTIEPAIDDLFLNYKYRSDDGSEVYAQQDAPKVINSITRATGMNKFNEKAIMYTFVVSHV